MRCRKKVACPAARSATGPSPPDLNPDDAPVHDEGLAAYAAETGLEEPLLPWHVLRTPVVDRHRADTEPPPSRHRPTPRTPQRRTRPERHV
ncbi:hypothetical protein [Streptomyces sp. NPDC001970]